VGSLPGLPKFFRILSSDGLLLFITRALRMFAYGFLSVVLVLYLNAQGIETEQIGLLLSMTLLGDVVISLWITTAADRIGRRSMLLLGATLMTITGAVFASTGNFFWLIIAATIGVLSPSDKEVGPFLSIEQAALSQTVSDEDRTHVFAWYNLIGSLTAAFGALFGGFACEAFLRSGVTGPAVYHPLVVAYAAVGAMLFVLFLRLTSAAESHEDSGVPPDGRWFGLHRSRNVVLRLSALFAMDAFGGGFLMQSIIAYWFHVTYHMEPAVLGSMFFVANIFAGFSSLAAAALARRIGLIRTMVFTHLPSNILLILVPLMPNRELAVALFLLRFSISQMDIPTRQSYTMSVVHPDERSAASGITTVARSLGAILSPSIAGYCFAHPQWINLPFFLAGGIKIAYDLILYRAFITLNPTHEKQKD